MSFIDLMGDVVWSDDDITNRTESMVRAEFSVQEELILNRKMQGVAAGIYQLTQDEQEAVQRFQMVCFLAQQEGLAARADMALLLKAMAYEVAEQVLLREAEAEVPNEGAIADAQAVIDAADAETITLVETRRGQPQ